MTRTCSFKQVVCITEWIFALHSGTGYANSTRPEKVFSIEKIADELAAGTDELSQWAAQRGNAFFLAPDPQMLGTLGTVSEWVQNQNYRPAAVSAFLQNADYYLIVHALAHDHIVVTHEVPSDGVRQVKIPNVCIGLNVKCMTPYEMLRRERARFVLGDSGARG